MASFFWKFWPNINHLAVTYLHLPQISLTHWPLFFQGLLVFFIIDFLSWWTHRALHTFPWLWKIHRTHHSITELNFLRVLYYNPLENIVYSMTTIFPLVLFSFDRDIFAYLAVINACIGYMNHANTKIRIPTWMAKIINTPQVHIWHHDESHPKKSGKNFGINLSLWDWLFGTLFLSKTDPEKIGIEQ